MSSLNIYTMVTTFTRMKSTLITFLVEKSRPSFQSFADIAVSAIGKVPPVLSVCEYSPSQIFQIGLLLLIMHYNTSTKTWNRNRNSFILPHLVSPASEEQNRQPQRDLIGPILHLELLEISTKDDKSDQI